MGLGHSPPHYPIWMGTLYVFQELWAFSFSMFSFTVSGRYYYWTFTNMRNFNLKIIGTCCHRDSKPLISQLRSSRSLTGQQPVWNFLCNFFFSTRLSQTTSSATTSSSEGKGRREHSPEVDRRDLHLPDLDQPLPVYDIQYGVSR